MQLARLSALPTAISNVMLGYLLATQLGGGSFHLVELMLLIAASSAMYSAGMILNDVFDIDVDRLERPERPLPAGKIGLRTARTVGLVLLLAGPLIAMLAGWIIGPNHAWSILKPFLVASLLCLAIVAYDGVLKRTFLAPVSMGFCRTLNLLLGACTFSPVDGSDGTWLGFAPVIGWLSAALGVYVAGITLFAKQEAEQKSNTVTLMAGALITIAGLLAMVFANTIFPFVPVEKQNPMLPMLLALVALPVLRRMLMAAIDRKPRSVQAAVGTALRSIIVFDATLCFLAAPNFSSYALWVVALLVPSLLLSRWTKVT